MVTLLYNNRQPIIKTEAYIIYITKEGTELEFEPDFRVVLSAAPRESYAGLLSLSSFCLGVSDTQVKCMRRVTCAKCICDE